MHGASQPPHGAMPGYEDLSSNDDSSTSLSSASRKLLHLRKHHSGISRSSRPYLSKRTAPSRKSKRRQDENILQ